MVSNSSSSVLDANSPGARAVLPAREVHKRLCQALAELQKAERNAVLWFAEVVRRKVYKELGYSSIHQYAEVELGFSPSKTSQFLRLSESLVRLPRLRRALARKEIPWTKAREVATVATPKTEARWIQEAKKVPRRVLEKRVKETRRQARAGSPGDEQPTLEMGLIGADLVLSPGNVITTSEPGRGSEKAAEVGVDPATPVNVQLRMTAEQYARYRALLETVRKHGAGSDPVELLLASLEQMAMAGGTGLSMGKSEPEALTSNSQADRPSEFPRGKSKVTRSPYQVIVHECPTCNQGSIATDRGEKQLSPKDLRTILCDAYRRSNGGRNRARVPARLRRAVLERDRYRCRAAGCGRTSFLAVHHLAPREASGGNVLDNLITLCSGCHKALHDHA